MPVIDIIFLVLIILMVIHGFVKGFIDELFSWASLVLGLGAAVFLYSNGAAFIRTKMMANIRFIPEIIAFVAIFLIVILVLKMLERLLKDVVEGTKLGGADKILGAVFGLVEGLFITAIIIFVLAVQPLFDAAPILVNSVFAQVLLPIIRKPLEMGNDALHNAGVIHAIIGLPAFFA
jgi:membrane protein required for colicin V production